MHKARVLVNVSSHWYMLINIQVTDTSSLCVNMYETDSENHEHAITL